MNTASVSSEIFYQLSLVADDQSCLDKILAYLKSITSATRTAFVSTYPSKQLELLNKLSDLQEYEQGWDGENAVPLEKKTVKNFKSVLRSASDNLLNGWTIEPKINGTLLMVSDDRNAVINIANDTISYYMNKNGQNIGCDPIPFSVDKTIKILTKWKA